MNPEKLRRYKRYTKEEDSIIIECVRNHMYNIHKGLIEASLKTNRTLGSLHVRWYTVLRKSTPTSKGFVLMSDNIILNNYKVIKTEEIPNKKEKLPFIRKVLQRIDRLLGLD